MTAIDVLLYLAACVSLTNIVVREGVFYRVREWVDKVFPRSLLNEMLRCEACTGFHAGWILALAFPSFGIDPVIGALVSSIACKTYVLLLLKF